MSRTAPSCSCSDSRATAIESLEPRRLLTVTLARFADDFVDSIGVNIHAHYTDRPYALDKDAWLPFLEDSGIRHVRDALVPASTSSWLAGSYTSILEDLADQGIRTTMILPNSGNVYDANTSVNSAWTTANYRLGADVIEAFEGVNEYDFNGGGTNAANRTIEIHGLVRGDAVWEDRPLLGPSVVWPERSDDTGDLTGYVDYGNIHSYPYVRPSAPSYDIRRMNAGLDLQTGDLGVQVTETGASTAINDHDSKQPVTLDQHGVFIPKTLLAGFNENVGRTFNYEMLDQFDDATLSDEEKEYGLLDFDDTGVVGDKKGTWTGKPGYWWIRNAIDVLGDATLQTKTEDTVGLPPETTHYWEPNGFTPGSLDFDLDGDTANVHHTLMQKSDGTFYLALWRDAVSSDSNGTPVEEFDVPSGDVTLRFGEDVGTVRLYNNLVASSGGTNSSTLTKTDLGVDRSQVTVPLDDRVVLVSIGGVTGDPQAVAHWDFDHVNSVLTSLDRTGNDHTLDHVGDFRKTGNSYSTMRGYGLGLTADGHGKAGNILNTSQSFTASAWVRLDDTSGSDTAVSAVGNHRSAFDLGVNSGQFRFRVFAADTSPVTQAEARASFNYAQDTWYHLTGVYDASADTAKLYVDGILVDTVAVPAGVFNANAATYVGASGTGTNPTKELDGILDEVMLYQEALDADEVAALSGGRLDPRASWTVTASNSKAGNGPANAIDGVLNNRWHSGIGQYDGMWLQLNRGSDDRPFNRIVLETGVPVSDPDNQGKIDDFVKSYSVYTSDNGTDWSSQPAQTSATQSRLVTDRVGSSQMHIWLPEASTAQYVRIEADSASSKWWAVNELELHGGPVGTDIAADLTPDANGHLFAEAEDYNSDVSQVSQSGDSWSQQPGGSDGYHMEVGPDNGDLNDSESGTKANSPRLSWIADFDEPGRYYVWLRGKAGGSTKGTSDSAHATVDGATFSTSDRMSDFATSFGWRSSTMDSARSFIDIDAPGFARFDVYMREDGFDLDAVLLTTDSTHTPAEPAPVPNSTTQAEGATRASAPIQDEHAGFNGSGYVNLGASGSSVEFEPDGGGGGLARLTFRFANGSTSNRTASLFVNGTSVGTIVAAPTGGWSTWSTVSVDVAFASGTNTVRLQTTGQDWGNLDQLSVAAV